MELVKDFIEELTYCDNNSFRAENIDSKELKFFVNDKEYYITLVTSIARTVEVHLAEKE